MIRIIYIVVDGTDGRWCPSMHPPDPERLRALRAAGHEVYAANVEIGREHPIFLPVVVVAEKQP